MLKQTAKTFDFYAILLKLVTQQWVNGKVQTLRFDYCSDSFLEQKLSPDVLLVTTSTQSTVTHFCPKECSSLAVLTDLLQ